MKIDDESCSLSKDESKDLDAEEGNYDIMRSNRSKFAEDKKIASKDDLNDIFAKKSIN